jgi:hypothetical protein
MRSLLALHAPVVALAAATVPPTLSSRPFFFLSAADLHPASASRRRYSMAGTSVLQQVTARPPHGGSQTSRKFFPFLGWLQRAWAGVFRDCRRLMERVEAVISLPGRLC